MALIEASTRYVSQGASWQYNLTHLDGQGNRVYALFLRCPKVAAGMFRPIVENEIREVYEAMLLGKH